MNTMEAFQTRKQQGAKITMLTAYDYPTAVFQDQAGVDVILIGDSVGRNMLGYDSEIQVTMADMLHHVGAVARGVKQAYVLADMPYQSCQTGSLALDNASRLIEAGAHGVKIEGEEEVAEQVAIVASAGIEVCAHIGYTPQTDGAKASVQGRDFERARELIAIARRLEEAGAGMIVFELIPEELARSITGLLSIPTIGIGAGPYCDGQVQVYCDILGLSQRIFRHAKAYDNLGDRYREAFAAYVDEVKAGVFPTTDNASALPEEVARQVDDFVRKNYGQ
ncbi:MAG: 3-methyl-2-oxobutanoate hydroxymethyltransferase [Desulfosudaceae bacterium]